MTKFRSGMSHLYSQAIAFILVLTFSQFTYAFDSLTGIKSFKISVSCAKYEFKKLITCKIAKENIQKMVEIRFRQAGITFQNKNNSIPLFKVYYEAITQLGVYASRIEISVHEDVKIKRNSMELSNDFTWLATQMFMGPRKNLSSQTELYLKRLMDNFLSDYAKANPKK